MRMLRLKSSASARGILSAFEAKGMQSKILEIGLRRSALFSQMAGGPLVRV